MQYKGPHLVQLLSSGEELFESMCDAMAQAQSEIWMATYIFNDDSASWKVAQALAQAAARGVKVHVLVDGFGSKATLDTLRQWWQGTTVRLEVFRPLDRWWAWLQPGQLRRMHQKLCAVDGTTAFVGGINIIDDRLDLHHGWSDRPRLDFAVRVQGPVVADVEQVTQALWTRANLGRGWREELAVLARSTEPLSKTLQLLRDLRSGIPRRMAPLDPLSLPPVRVALAVRDNFRQRRAIERIYIEAIGRAQSRLDIACPYFYPGRAFRRSLRRAAARGVQVRLLMQGKIDYRFAALAARVLYDELLAWGVKVFEYTPAFLHAKVAVVDDDWATVGSSNIDPLSLLLNLEANLVIQDQAFVAGLKEKLDVAFSESHEITAPALRPGLRGWFSRGLVAWIANTYLRIAGITGRY